MAIYTVSGLRTRKKDGWLTVLRTDRTASMCGITRWGIIKRKVIIYVVMRYKHRIAITFSKTITTSLTPTILLPSSPHLNQHHHSNITISITTIIVIHYHHHSIISTTTRPPLPTSQHTSTKSSHLLQLSTSILITNSAIICTNRSTTRKKKTNNYQQQHRKCWLCCNHYQYGNPLSFHHPHQQ